MQNDLYFHLHGIYYEHFGSKPQDTIGYLYEGCPLRLEAITDNKYDCFAVAVFHEKNFIGWIPSDDNRLIHNLVLYSNIDVKCFIHRLYPVDKGYGAEIHIIYFTEDYNTFDPYALKQIYNNDLYITPVLEKFIYFIHNKSVKDLYIPQYWLLDYGTDAVKLIKKLIEYGYINISKSFSALKVDELRALLRSHNLPVSGKKEELIQRIYTSIPGSDIDMILNNYDDLYVATEKAMPIISSVKNSKNLEKELYTLKNKQLSEILRRNEYPYSGKKDELVQRILENFTYKEISHILSDKETYIDNEPKNAKKDEKQDEPLISHLRYFDYINNLKKNEPPPVHYTEPKREPVYTNNTPIITNISSKSFVTDLFLCVLFGWCGLHKFYEGKTKIGFLYIFTVGVFYIGWFVDIIIILLGKATDVEGKKIIKNH